MLRKLDLRLSYSSEEDDPYSDFYLPALAQTKVYRRAVGFFSLGVLLNAPAAMAGIVATEGRAELIFGKLVDPDDFEAIKASLETSALEQDVPSFEALIDEQRGSLLEYRIRMLAWLFREGRLEMKVAIRPKGMFHQKIGILEDSLGDVISFTGSMNETMSALDPRYNSEEIVVFRSWTDGQRDYVERHRAQFSRLWSGETGSATVIAPLPEAIRSGLNFVAERFPDRPTLEEEAERVRSFLRSRSGTGGAGARVPETLNGKPFAMKEHQLSALREWSANGYNGILELATGAGKTITSIYAATKTVEANEGMALIVAVPYQDLADQWCQELRLFNIFAVRCYGSRAAWEPQIRAYLDRNRGDQKEFIAIVVVNETLKSAHFQSYVAGLDRERLFFIGDECHHHGSEAFDSKLLPKARFRIGLSATPFHYLDEERNQRLRAIYDRSVFQYTLADAVADGVLTPYEYHPIPVELTEAEATDYAELSEQIRRIFVMAQNDKKGRGQDRLTALLTKRARLVGAAANKIPAIETLLAERGTIDAYSLFYCGDGRTIIDAGLDEEVDAGEDQAVMRQRSAVTQLLGKLGVRVSPFTSEESRWQRREILDRFKRGETEALVAIKCLDEGIDVPACRTAYLIASSRNPRQFIQRRGRILRRAEGKDFATIYDLVVVFPDGMALPGNMEADFLRNELARVADFASHSKFPASSIAPLRPWLERYGLEHLAV